MELLQLKTTQAQGIGKIPYFLVSPQSIEVNNRRYRMKFGDIFYYLEDEEGKRICTLAEKPQPKRAKPTWVAVTGYRVWEGFTWHNAAAQAVLTLII